VQFPVGLRRTHRLRTRCASADSGTAASTIGRMSTDIPTANEIAAKPPGRSKVYENLIRRTAARQLLALHRTRRRAGWSTATALPSPPAGSATSTCGLVSRQLLTSANGFQRLPYRINCRATGLG
jgi:hypothetical protein